MRHSKKKGEETRLPEQNAMGSADDYAPGGSASQGDGEGGDPSFSGASEVGGNASSTIGATDPAPEATRTDSDSTTQLSDSTPQPDRNLRLAAEYDNYRKRSAKERQDAGSRAQADLVRQMVEALDDVARFAHIDPATADAATIVQGVDMVEKKLLKTLGNAGLEIINPVGETFESPRQ